MKTITFATQKGGSGKSQLATSIAALAAAEGLRVAALDTDPQHTFLKWSRRRGDAPRVQPCEPHEVERTLSSLRYSHDLCLVDTPGADDPRVVPAITAADFCLVPVKPMQADLEAAVPTAKLLADRKKPYGFVLSMCIGNQARMNDAAAQLLKYGQVAACNVYNRVDYPDALLAGKGVTEWNPGSPAAKEIAVLWAWLQRAAGVEVAQA